VRLLGQLLITVIVCGLLCFIFAEVILAATGRN
jgi:hypothetical protein